MCYLAIGCLKSSSSFSLSVDVLRRADRAVERERLLELILRKSALALLGKRASGAEAYVCSENPMLLPGRDIGRLHEPAVRDGSRNGESDMLDVGLGELASHQV